MQNIGNVTNAINSNKQMFNTLTSQNRLNNKSQLVAAYTTDKTQFYNDQKTSEEAKRKKRNKILTLSFAGVSIIGIAATLVYEAAKGKLDLAKVWQQAKDTEAGQKTMSFFKKGLNLAVNFSNVKDDLWTRYTENIPFLNKANIKTENLYHGFAKGKYKGKYLKSKTILENESVTNIFGKNQIDNYDNWFNNMKDAIRNALLPSKENKTKHITEGLIKDAQGDTIGAKAKNIWKRLTTTVLSEENLTKNGNVRAQFANGTRKLKFVGLEEINFEDLHSKDKGKAKDAYEKLLKTVREKMGNQNIKLDDGKELKAEDIAKAIRDMDFIQTKGAQDVFERIRDTSLGNASTDILGVLASLGLLGGALATGENEAERKSTMINLGIPLLTTLSSMVIGTAACFSGGASLAFGLITGQLASLTASFVDKKTKEADLKKQTSLIA